MQTRPISSDFAPALLLLPLAACASVQGSFPYEHPDSERALVSHVSEERCVQRVRQLVELGPRMGGTPSGDKAADYLARQFYAHGLDVRITEDPELWCHHEDSWKVTATTAAGEERELERAWPYGFSPKSEGTATLSLEKQEGAALLVEWFARRRGIAALEDPAVVLVDGRNSADGEYPAVQHLSRGNENPVPVFGISAPEGEWLRQRADEGVTISWTLDATIEEARPKTVVARIFPADPETKGYFLFCAHGDSDAGGPGANDNGSGEAIVLEIATAWATALRAKQIAPPPFELRFAIWGSEIHSTRHYLEQLRESGDEVLGVLNYDQSGFGSTLDVLYFEPDDIPANEAFTRTLLGVVEEFKDTAGFPERWATNGTQGGTDSYVFSESKLFEEGSIPALTVYTSAWGREGKVKRTPGMPGESWTDDDVVNIDYDVYYHTTGDTPENTTDKEPFGMGWCARVGLVGSLRWLTQLRDR